MSIYSDHLIHSDAFVRVELYPSKVRKFSLSTRFVEGLNSINTSTKTRPLVLFNAQSDFIYTLSCILDAFFTYTRSYVVRVQGFTPRRAPFIVTPPASSS